MGMYRTDSSKPGGDILCIRGHIPRDVAARRLDPHSSADFEIKRRKQRFTIYRRGREVVEEAQANDADERAACPERAAVPVFK